MIWKFSAVASRINLYYHYFRKNGKINASPIQSNARAKKRFKMPKTLSTWFALIMHLMNIPESKELSDPSIRNMSCLNNSKQINFDKHTQWFDTSTNRLKYLQNGNKCMCFFIIYENVKRNNQWIEKYHRKQVEGLTIYTIETCKFYCKFSNSSSKIPLLESFLSEEFTLSHE